MAQQLGDMVAIKSVTPFPGGICCPLLAFTGTACMWYTNTCNHSIHTHKINIINLFKGKKKKDHCVFCSLPLPKFEFNIKIFLQASRWLLFTVPCD